MAGEVDYEAMLAEYRAMAEEYRTTIQDLRSDREQDRTVIEKLTVEVAKLTEQIAAPEAYKPADSDVLFDELMDLVNDYVNRTIPESIRKEIETAGDKANVISVYGPDRLRSTFCTSLTKALDKQLYVEPTAGAEIEEEIGVTDQTIKDTRAWVNAKCAEYKEDVKKAKKANGTHKGVFGSILEEWNRIDKIWGDLGDPTEEQKAAHDYAKSRYDGISAVKGRITAYLQGCGYFIVYLSLRGIKISDVTAETFTQFQDLIGDNADTAPETLNKFARDCKIFFEQLDNLEYMPEIPRRGRGSIPPRHYEAGATKKKPHAAFTLDISEKTGVDPNSCELCKLYRCLRSQKVNKHPNLKRAKKLIEICLRIQQETGLRLKFLLNLVWDDFSKKPVKQMPKGQPVYLLQLDRIRELVRHTKQLPDKDMYISGVLGKMINTYRNQEKLKGVLYGHYPVFNAMLLLGPYRDRTYASAIDGSVWRRMIVIPLEEACKINALPMKFRNTYYTVMLTALNYPTDKAFKQWTGDRVDTAETNYKAVEGIVKLPDSYINSLSYPEIVTHIFGKQIVWDSDKRKWV